MAYKSILVLVDGTPASAARIRIALHLAQTQEACVTGMFLAQQPVVPVDFGGSGAAELFNAAYMEVEREGLRARALFDLEVAGLSAERVSWEQHIGTPLPAACLHARGHDLAVVGQYNPQQGGDRLPPGFPEALGLAAGRPVLVIPYNCTLAATGNKVMLAWDGGRESARAIADALPVLRRAHKVTLATIIHKPAKQEKTPSPSTDINLYLQRQGIAVEVRQETALNISEGEAILSLAADLQADLIVMGLYGHSRLRELIVGGVSRTILAAMTAPVLMSH